MKDNIKVLNMQMPEQLYNKLKDLAKKKNISLASLIKIIATEYIDKVG